MTEQGSYWNKLNVILGTDTLKKINAVIDFENNNLICTVSNKEHSVELGNVDIDNDSEGKYIHITKAMKSV